MIAITLITLFTLFPYTTLFRSMFNVTMARCHLFQPGQLCYGKQCANTTVFQLGYGILLHITICFSLWSFHFQPHPDRDRKSTRLNSSHTVISYAVFCLKKNISI